MSNKETRRMTLEQAKHALTDWRDEWPDRPEIKLFRYKGNWSIRPDSRTALDVEAASIIDELGITDTRTVIDFYDACHAQTNGDPETALDMFAGIDGLTVCIRVVESIDYEVIPRNEPARPDDTDDKEADWSQWTDEQIDHMLTDIASRAAMLVADITQHQWNKLDGPDKPENSRRYCLERLDDLRGLLNRDAQTVEK